MRLRVGILFDADRRPLRAVLSENVPATNLGAGRVPGGSFVVGRSGAPEMDDAARERRRIYNAARASTRAGRAAVARL